MTARHFLTNIQEQGVVSCLWNVDSGFVKVPLAHLLTATLCGGDVYHLAGPLTLTPRQFNAAVAWVEIDESIIVPKDAITLTRQQHGQTDLGVYLRQPTAQSADVRIAVLELSESEEVFILGRDKGQRGFFTSHLMKCSRKHSLTLSVLHRQQLATIIDINIDVFR